jgi:hypothetical protein
MITEGGTAGGVNIGRGAVPSHTLSTASPTRTELGLKPDLRGGEPATNRLSYGRLLILKYYVVKIHKVAQKDFQKCRRNIN